MYVLRNSRIFDGQSDTLRTGQSVYVHGDRISEISDRKPTAADGEAIDCGGRTLMPGLIDAHVHVYANSVNVYEIDAAPVTLLATWATAVLHKMLDRGFTTVRDTGGADFGLWMALDRGYIKGPRLYYCGRLISQTGGHGDFRNPHTRDDHAGHMLMCGCGLANALAAVVDGVDAVRRVVRENLRRGASFIKFTASGGVASTGDRLDSVQFSDEEIAAIVDEVNRHGVYCTAHIHPDVAIKRAVRLGVQCIEHGTLIEPDTARMAADHGTYIVPTLATIDALSRHGTELGFPPKSIEKLNRISGEAIERMRYMKDAGVRIGFGTDLLGKLEDQQCTEFSLRTEVFSNYEILLQATSMNAEIIGAKDKLGVIREGALADILLVNGNPLNDLDILAKDGAMIDAIMQGGEFHKRVL